MEPKETEEEASAINTDNILLNDNIKQSEKENEILYEQVLVGNDEIDIAITMMAGKHNEQVQDRGQSHLSASEGAAGKTIKKEN